MPDIETKPAETQTERTARITKRKGDLVKAQDLLRDATNLLRGATHEDGKSIHAANVNLRGAQKLLAELED